MLSRHFGLALGQPCQESALLCLQNRTKGPAAGKTQTVSLAGQTAPGTMDGDDAFARRPRAGAQIPEKIQKHPWRQVCDHALHLVTLSPFWKAGRESASSIKALLCGRGEARAFDDIAKYFSKKEWERMKVSEKIVYVYKKRKYEAMSKLGNRKF
ncbi:hypothetical protein H8959_000346 [Pygathrix nigripes]